MLISTRDHMVCADCGHEAELGDTFGQIEGSWYCHKNDCYEVAAEAYTEYQAEMDGPDPHGYFDPTPEEQAGWVFEDRLAMYRNEY